MKSKFIRVKELHEAQDVFILFPRTITHKDMAHSLGVDLISAGFYQTDFNGIYRCSGESVSLDIKSREDDSEQLNKQMRGYF